MGLDHQSAAVLSENRLDDLAWAEVHRNWRGRPRYQCVVSALPEGVMRLSPLEPNIVLPHELESHIRVIAASSSSQGTDRSSAAGVPRAATVTYRSCSAPSRAAPPRSTMEFGGT